PCSSCARRRARSTSTSWPGSSRATSRPIAGPTPARATSRARTASGSKRWCGGCARRTGSSATTTKRAPTRGRPSSSGSSPRRRTRNCGRRSATACCPEGLAVLAVVLLAADVAARAAQVALQVAALAARQAVAARAVAPLLAPDPRLLATQPRRLVACELVRAHAFADALALPVLAGVDRGCVGRRKGQEARHHQHRPARLAHRFPPAPRAPEALLQELDRR